MNNQSILNAVQNQYGAVARSSLSNVSAAVQSVAKAFGYSSDELSSIPSQANMGLSCGNPVAVAGLREGEVVVDLGSGGGLDAFLAAQRVGPTGKAIGIDMTPDMIDRAKSGHALKPAKDSQTTRYREDGKMKTIQVYDKPMCCSTGVCGPEVDPVLPRFAADLQWLKSQGHSVERFNLAQQPEAFIQNPEVHKLLATQGTNSLPLIVVDRDIVSRGAYPSREELVRWTEVNKAQTSGYCGGPAKDASKACCAADEQAQAATGTGCGCAETSNKRITSGCC